MPTLSGLARECAIAETFGAERGLTTWPALAVPSVTGESEVAARELVAPVSALTFLDYVSMYGCVVISNHKIKRKRIKENKENKRE